MGYGLRLLAIFTCSALLFISGILMFTKGFLLKRIVIDDINKCNESIPWSSNRYPKSSQHKGCWVDPSFKKAVVIIIDALRYDFALFNESISDENVLPFQNKLVVFHEILKSSPHHAKLYRFLADPPTTTMQRLKGLTTGSLPTFVDAGSNFASYSIKEDNIITKLVDHGRNITFMGDDTWVGLFPGLFHKSFPFPSFNVKDLHTVDNGVIKHLVPELKQNDWDVIIGHFLGVDHCGHKYGPYHREMANKLRQMDQVLRSVIDTLDDSTILFVLGDHGMTKTGDHGGDSEDELDAALFVYSKKPLLSSHSLEKSPSTISQIDFVPTFSLLLGLPIPFGSLGSALTELFTKQAFTFNTPKKISLESKDLWNSIMNKLKILQLNAYQVNKYLHRYQEKTDEIPKHTLHSLQKKFENVSLQYNQLAEFVYFGKTNSNIDVSIKNLQLIEKQYVEYLNGVKELCQGMWAKFDIISMSSGILLQIFAIVTMFLIILDPQFFRKVSSSMLKKISIFVTFGGGFCAVITPENLPKVFFNVLLCLASSFGAVFLYHFLKDKTNSLWKVCRTFQELTTMDIISLILCGSYFSSWLSNSYIVYEDSTLHFLLSSFLSLQFIVTLAKSKSSQSVIKIANRNSIGISKKTKKEAQKIDFKSIVTSTNFRLFIVVLAFMICGRISTAFQACREEQFPCEPSGFLQPLLALQGTNANINERFLLSSLCAIVLPLSLYQWLRFQGNLNGSTPVVLAVRYGLPFSAVFVCIHWALQILPQTTNNQFSNLQFWQQIILPQFVYSLCLLTILLLLWQPLCLYTLLRDSKSVLEDSLNRLAVGDTLDSSALKTVFQEVKKNWDNEPVQSDAEDNRPPVVYGLGTVYSSPVFVVVTCVAMVTMIVLSDGMAGAVVLMIAQMILCAEIQTSCQVQPSKCISWPAVVMWGLMTSQYFFSTGHQATIPAIRFEAAFVGLPGDMKNLVLPGLLIFLNTFASSVIFSVGIPVLVLWPRISNRILGKSPRSHKLADKGEFGLTDDTDGLREDFFRLLMMYLAFNSFKVLFCSCSAAIHRRHLMVWKIFAPRFVFECASFLVSLPFLVFVYLLILRTDSALKEWTEKLEKIVALKNKLS